MAATHTGHCQICGRQHKITRNHIAKHGYTIRYGWQDGACFGSGAKPYELSNDLLPPAIEGAKRYIESTTARIADLKANALAEVDGDGYVIADVTINHSRERRSVRITMSDAGKIEAHTVADKVLQLYLHEARRAKSVDEALRVLADHRIKYLRATVGEAKLSLEYMQERHDAWKLAPLIPLTAADIAASAPKVHFQVQLKNWKFASTACSASYSAADRNRYRAMTTDASKVTCSACRKEVARIAT